MALGGALTNQMQCIGSGQKIRVALSVLNAPGELKLVLDGFLETGVDCRQVLLIANCERAVMSVEMALRHWNNGGDDGLRPVLINSADSSSGSACAQTEQLANYAEWMDERLSCRLSKQLETGFCLLIVPLADINSELAVSEVLLKHTLNSVQLHDLVLTASMDKEV